MTHYAWTISKPGRQDIKEVTTILELQDVLRVLDLPSTDVFMHVDQTMSDNGRYTNDEGSMDEWSLTWKKVDDEAAVVD